MSQKKDKKIVEDTWLYSRDEDGHVQVKTLNLANKLMETYHFTFSFFAPHGYWWDPQTKRWMGKADSHLRKIIPKILEDEAGIMGNPIVSQILTNIQTSKGMDESLTDKFALENRNPHLVNFNNGTYDLDQDRILPSRFDNYILENHNYNLGEVSKDNTWDRWLYESMVDPYAKKDGENHWTSEGDPNAPETFKAYIGWALAGSYKEFQHVMLIYGNGGEGKSTMLNIIEALLGEANISNVDLGNLGDMDKARFQLAKLHREELNYSDDVGDRYIKETNILKRLTGGNRLTAEYKGQDPFEFINEAKLIFTCNSLPSFHDTSHGMERRPIIIDWRRIRNFKGKYKMADFIRDRPSFVRECLLAYRNSLQAAKNMSEPRLPMTEYMEQRVREWFQTNDVIGNWINENCELGDDQKVYREQTATLYNNYTRYCRESGAQPLRKTKFNVEMKKRGVQPNKNIKINGKSTKCYAGIRRIIKYQSDLY